MSVLHAIKAMEVSHKLNNAVDNGDLESIKELSKTATLGELREALDGAAYHNLHEIALFLVSLDVDLKYDSAMWTASSYGHHRVLKILHEKYDVLTYKDNHGETLLSVALCEAYHDDDSDHDNDNETIRFLIEQCGLDINHQNNSGSTLLHKLADGNEEDVVFILKYKPDLSIKDNNGVSIIDAFMQHKGEILSIIEHNLLMDDVVSDDKEMALGL